MASGFPETWLIRLRVGRAQMYVVSTNTGEGPLLVDLNDAAAAAEAHRLTEAGYTIFYDEGYGKGYLSMPTGRRTRCRYDENGMAFLRGAPVPILRNSEIDLSKRALFTPYRDDDLAHQVIKAEAHTAEAGS